jgi:DNA polymerase-3 subunit epsilon
MRQGFGHPWREAANLLALQRSAHANFTPMVHDPKLEALAVALEASGSYRVLRRMQAPQLLDRAELPANAREAVVLDLETTGLDPRQDRPIEIGLVRFAYDEEGRVLGVTDTLGGLEDPGAPLAEAVVRLTGIRDEDVSGQAFPDQAIERIMAGVGLVIAHNASFDRPFAERRWPLFAALHWACSFREVDWDALPGYMGRSLTALLATHGLFFGAHRAVEDAQAVVEVLRQPWGDGRSTFAQLRDVALRNAVRIWAVAAPFDQKDVLKGRGYRWNPEAKSWWVEVSEEGAEAELAFLQRHVYGSRWSGLPTLRVSGRERYSQRVSEQPPS